MSTITTSPHLEEFLSAYIETALWSSTDNSNDQGGDPLDANYSADDLAQETLLRFTEDCTKFLSECELALQAAVSLAGCCSQGRKRMATRNNLQIRAGLVNRVIHGRNLYLKNDRFINATVEKGGIYVRSIHTGKLEKYEDGKFTDCNGDTVRV